jgi:hypothetical protein
MYEKREGSHYYQKNEGGGITETVQVMKLMLSNLRRKEW